MPECPIETGDNLYNVLIILNKFVLKADKYARLLEYDSNSDKSKVIKFGAWFNNFKLKIKNKTDKQVYGILSEEIQDGAYHETTTGHLLFNKKRNIQPWYGEGEKNDLFFNKDLVIGVKQTLYDGSTVAYRVDYDPKKGLHINFDLTIYYKKNESRVLNYALIVSPDSTPKLKRYAINIANIEESKRLELTQLKFFVKFTLDYLRENPSEVVFREKPPEVKGMFEPTIKGFNEKEEKNVVWFLQRQPFYPSVLFQYVFTYISDYGKAESAEIKRIIAKIKQIDPTKKKLGIINIFSEEKILRHSLVEIAVALFKKANDKALAQVQDNIDNGSSEKQFTTDSPTLS